jgi:hypothetical protein
MQRKARICMQSLMKRQATVICSLFGTGNRLPFSKQQLSRFEAIGAV